ncbi:hypothetical protein [Daejeonella lutea]|uniref:Uncharacterized protein n=1 Tax=Daejeonella lutea TaxID=572036 RepID=A0A1T5ESC9_9SPHI|nr:hypothetical protein [Daejeonella lutea]SKB86882.1 hypothetical protein SAMN05661099_3177 [Daejeonella lutea]
MILNRFVKNSEKRNRVIHIVFGFIILIHAWEKYETGHGPFVFFLIAGLIFITLAILHPVLEKKYPWIDGVFFVIEGTLSLAVAYDYFHMGKKALPFAYLGVAMLQYFVAFRKSRKGIAHHKAKYSEPVDPS